MKTIGCGRTRAAVAGAGCRSVRQRARRSGTRNLQTCSGCREQARLLDEIVLAVGVMPSPDARSARAHARARLATGLAQVPEPPSFWKSRSALALGGVALVGALAAAVIFVTVSGGSTLCSPRWSSSRA